MIKVSILSVLLICRGLATYAQVDQNRYYLPDGKEVASDKLDSVAKSWGGKYKMSRDKSQPREYRIFPITDED
jgi:hypothetical protein